MLSKLAELFKKQDFVHPPKADDILVAEYTALRAEIVARFQTASTFTLAELTLLGVSAPLMGRNADVLVAAAFLTSFIWLAWMELIEGLFKIAAYIAIVLSRQLSDSNRRALDWERFLRTISIPHFQRNYEAFPKGSESAMSGLLVGSGRGVIPYMAVLFGPVPVALLAFYALRLCTDQTLVATHFSARARWFSFTMAVVLHVYSCIQFFLYLRIRREIGVAIRKQTSEGFVG